MEKQERVRLLIVEGEDTVKGRGGRISHGAATLVSRWPGYILSAIWFFIFVISVVTILMLFIFMLLVKEERRILGGKTVFSKHNQNVSYKLNNEFCQVMTSESSPGKRELPNIEMFNTGNNIFYVRTKPLNKPSSCAVESVLINFRNKNVFIMMFEDYPLDYEKELKNSYTNLILSKVDGNKYLKGTNFKWDQDNYNKSMIAAGLITVWQFGGMILSDNLMSYKNTDSHTETIEGSCKVDYELLFCAEQCSGYVYDFINSVVDYNMQEGAAPVIEKSILKFCGKAVRDCDGARRAKHICDNPTSEPDCEFVRLDSWLEKDTIWKNISKYCPVTDKHSSSEDAKTTEGYTTKEMYTSKEKVTVNTVTNDDKMATHILLNTSRINNPTRITSSVPVKITTIVKT